jgi:hypothetical protein
MWEHTFGCSVRESKEPVWEHTFGCSAMQM